MFTFLRSSTPYFISDVSSSGSSFFYQSNLGLHHPYCSRGPTGQLPTFAFLPCHRRLRTVCVCQLWAVAGWTLPPGRQARDSPRFFPSTPCSSHHRTAPSLLLAPLTSCPSRSPEHRRFDVKPEPPLLPSFLHLGELHPRCLLPPLLRPNRASSPPLYPSVLGGHRRHRG
jgi:hypothetical protein